MSARDKVSYRALKLLKVAVPKWRLSYFENGPMVSLLEQTFEKVHGRPGVAVSSCTSALEMTFRHLARSGIRRVLVPANGQAADVLGVYRALLRPVFVDVEPDMAGMPSVDTIAGKLQGDCKDTAVLVVHIGTVYPQLEELVKLCRSLQVPLVEDCAHVLGVPGVGIADFATYSMFATKVVPSGEGGIVSPRDPSLVEYFKRMRVLGRNSEFGPCVDLDGVNAKMSELNACFGVAALENAQELIDERLAVCKVYEELLQTMRAGVSWYDGMFWYGGAGYKMMIKTAGSAKEIEEQWKAAGVNVGGRVYDDPLPSQVAFREFAECCVGNVSAYKGAERFCDGHVCLKTTGTVEEAKKNAEKIVEWWKKVAPEKEG